MPRLIWLCTALVLGVLAACGNGSPGAPSGTAGPAAPGTAGVSLGSASLHASATDQLVFVPATLHARVGQVIQWTNTGTVLHTVTFDAHPSLTDNTLQPGGTWSVRFTQTGTYPYRCTIHPGMDGTLVVSS